MKLTLEGPKLEPTLVTRFYDIKQKPEISPTVNDFSNVFGDEADRKYYFEEAKKSFDFVYKKKKFISAIQKEENKESFAYLKQVRRYGLILRALYRFVDTNHKCPEGLQQFISLLGTYNDSYKLSPSKRTKEQILSTLDSIAFPVNFIDTLNFKKYVAGLLAETEGLLQGKTLPVGQFHTLRKRLRLFADLLQVSAAEDYGGNLHWLFYSLIQLSSEMGDHHDDLMQKGLRGKIDYDAQVVEVKPHIVSEFERLKPYIEKVCDVAA